MSSTARGIQNGTGRPQRSQAGAAPRDDCRSDLQRKRESGRGGLERKRTTETPMSPPDPSTTLDFSRTRLSLKVGTKGGRCPLKSALQAHTFRQTSYKLDGLQTSRACHPPHAGYRSAPAGHREARPGPHPYPPVRRSVLGGGGEEEVFKTPAADRPEALGTPRPRSTGDDGARPGDRGSKTHPSPGPGRRPKEAAGGRRGGQAKPGPPARPPNAQGKRGAEVRTAGKDLNKTTVHVFIYIFGGTAAQKRRRSPRPRPLRYAF